MTTEQLEQANSIQQQIDYVTEQIRIYQNNIRYINKRIEKEQSDMKVEVSLPCDNNTIEFVDKLIQTCNVELEFLKEQFNSI